MASGTNGLIVSVLCTIPNVPVSVVPHPVTLIITVPLCVAVNVLGLSHWESDLEKISVQLGLKAQTAVSIVLVPFP